ncbi:MAG: DUF58 domain-containing protein [Agrococcus casei]|uniref:DUF58 domain-containing protein n=1 Tax=Agrococcus casei TaxID=343512 RepID=UPI003F91805A
MHQIRQAFKALTGWGWALVATALVGPLAAWLLGWQELLLFGVGAIVLLVSAVPWVLRGRSIGIELSLSAPRVAVGAPAQALLRVRRSGRFALPNSVDLELGGVPVTIALPKLSRGDQHDIRLPIDTSSRGRIDVGPVHLSHTDPLGILERRTRLSEGLSLMVHPRTVRIPAASSGLVRDLEGEASQDLSTDDVAFHSLRDYQPGDDPRIVHWRTSAKHGTLLVRQFEPSRRSDTVICFTSAPEEVSREDFELALSIVATIGSATLMDRRALRVIHSAAAKEVGAPELDVVTRDRMLDALTEVDRAEALPLQETLNSLAATREAAILWLVVGGDTGTRTLREALARVPVDVAPVIVRAHESAPPQISKLGSVPVLTIGVLEDLIRELSHGVSA